MHIMANDIPFYYHKAGVRQFDYMHVTTANWGTKALTNFQMARQLWTVDTNCEPLWEDYFEGRYGAAADTMRQFYELLEKMLCNCTALKYKLSLRLANGKEELFPDSHLRYRREPGVACDGPTLVEIVELSKSCRELIDQVSASKLPERIKSRIAEDERLFTYGERTIAYYDACAQAFQLARAGNRKEARRHYIEAQRLAKLLRHDTTSVLYSYDSGGAAANALAASNAEGALVHLAKLLDAPE